MKRMFTTRRILLLIIVCALLLRLHGVDWDQGFHLHPDERAIVMAVDGLSYPSSFEEFLSPDSPWNPKFFAYGSFPMYLLQLAGNGMGFFNPEFAEYTKINIVGRFISAFFDVGTVLMLFFIGRKLFKPTVGLVAAFFYAISVLPIQLSHFYAVDTLLTFFISTTLYVLLLLYEKPTILKSVLAGVFFGLALATKVSAIVVLFSIVSVFFIDALIAFILSPRAPKQYVPLLKRGLSHSVTYGIIILSITLISFAVFEPYAVLDNKTFWEQTLYQSMMTKDAFIFPYTLQYVGKIPYIYELQNIFLFGLGPVLAILCFVGTGYVIMSSSQKKSTKAIAKILILLAFFISYFWVVGGFAIGFMRYMLPVYPLLCLFGAMFLYQLYKRLHTQIKNPSILFIAKPLFFILLLIWPLSFIGIYSQDNPRTKASDWINENIPVGKAIAIEHWDDGLPLVGQEKYFVITLGLYEPDTPEKWALVKSQLEQTDYIIIGSNRLYTPLQKLIHCEKLPPDRCYTQTADYYQKLFSELLGFEKVAEFTSYPTIPLTNVEINDQAADESFTVYDHPKVMIFQKIDRANP